jgi:hypothetical protein
VPRSGRLRAVNSSKYARALWYDLEAGGQGHLGLASEPVVTIWLGVSACERGDLAALPTVIALQRAVETCLCPGSAIRHDDQLGRLVAGAIVVGNAFPSRPASSASVAPGGTISNTWSITV